MSGHARAALLGLALTLALAVMANTQTRVPRIWDDVALADWATPLAALKIRPAHYTTAEYYLAPSDNLRTYPVYRPDKEPAGYWEDLQRKKPEPLVDVATIRTTQDWIAAGARASAISTSLSPARTIQRSSRRRAIPGPSPTLPDWPTARSASRVGWPLTAASC